METTGINKTVYRSDVISALDSFTSVCNVLAWEMFQDGQVRNYDGVIGDLKRLYPNIDFDSVTENINPESIAADENAIYALVDNIINKLIESGISKDNFNYAIWACDDPENVADTYGVDIDDVSAYKITDGILLQDLGYEGQLYGVAEYPEEEWDVIESALKGGNMKTREDYKDYYLEQLTEQFGDMTEADYNSAKKFCYDEEWNLGEVGNMAEAIDGLGDAWTEYQKQYKEGFEIMNNRIIKSSNEITRGLLMTEGGETLNLYEMDGYIRYQRGFDMPVNWDNPHYGFADVSRELGWRKASQDDEKGLLVRGDTPELKERHNAIRKLIGNSRQIKSSKDSDLNILADYLDDNWGDESRRDIFKRFKQEHPETSLEFIDFVKYQNDYDVNDDTPYEYEDENGRLYSWDMIKKEIDDWIKDDSIQGFRKMFEYGNNEFDDKGYYSYFEKDHETPNYDKIYMDFWDISSNGAMSEVEGTEEQWNEYNEQHGITSAKGNDMKKNIKSSVEDVYYNRDFSQYDDAREYAEKLANKLKDITIIEDTFETKVDYYVDGKFNHSADIFSEKENYDNLIIIKHRNGLFSVSYKGSKIKSSKENNMKTPIKSGYTGTNVSVEYGPYGEEKEFPLYDITGETVEEIDEELGYYDEVKAAWGSDGESYMILENRAYSEDKIAVLEDDYNEWVEAMDNEDYTKVIKSSHKSIKSDIDWESQKHAFDNKKYKIYKTNIDGEWEEYPFYGTDNISVADKYESKGYLVKSSRNIKSSYSVENDIYAVYVDDEVVEIVANTNIPGYEYISMNEYGDIAYHNSFRPNWFDKFKKKWGTVSDVEEQSNVRMYGPKVLDAIEKSLEYDKYEKDMKENGTMYEWKDYEGNWNPIDPDTSTMAMCRTNNIPVRPVKSSKENNMKIQSKRAIKSGRYIKSGAGAGYDITVRGIELDNHNWKILNDDYDERYDSHTVQVEIPVKPCVAEYWSAEAYYEGIDSSHDIYDSKMDRQIDGGTAILQLEVYPPQWIKGDIMTSEELNEAINDLLPSELNLTMMYGGGWLHVNLPEEGIIFDDDNGRINLDEGEIYDYTTVKCELKCPNITQNINAFFKNPDAYYDEDGMPQYPGEDDEINSSRKPVKSGLTFRQAVQDFKAAGQWNDYYEMQQDWESYKDGLERDGLISEKTRSTWGNPCTPETFKRWDK